MIVVCNNSKVHSFYSESEWLDADQSGIQASGLKGYRVPNSFKSEIKFGGRKDVYEEVGVFPNDERVLISSEEIAATTESQVQAVATETLF